MGNYMSVFSSGNYTSEEPKKHKGERGKIEEIVKRSVNTNVFAHLDEEPCEELNNQGESASVRKCVLNDTDRAAMAVDPGDYEYPFENLVFEGGGNKGLAYCGAIRVFEKLGIDKQIKRYAGASAGAMMAVLLAVGYNSYEIETLLGLDISPLLLDAQFGYLSLLPNLIRRYGWNSGNKIYEWFGQKLAEKTNNPDITFAELYKKYQKELCVVVTNVNHMVEEYCHPKTTPDMPIRLAVRMSMAIPGMFQATMYTDKGETNTYVDGGVLCNYPIHCFDGWWLSMNPGDSFLEKLQPLEAIPELLDKNNRFRPYSDKTVGFQLYADCEQEQLRWRLERRIGTELPEVEIQSKLFKENKEKKKIQENAKREHGRATMAVDAFLKVLKTSNLDRDHVISRTELEHAFKSSDFSATHQQLLFGDDISVDDVFKALDEDGNGEIQYHELVNFIQTRGILLQQRFLGYQRKEITGLCSFLTTLQNTILNNVKRVFVEETDLDRTVGINTGHVGTTDFTLEQADKDFVVKQGERSTEAFLKYFVVKNPDAVKKKSKMTPIGNNN